MVTIIVEGERKHRWKRRGAALPARTKGGRKRVRKLEGNGVNKLCASGTHL